MTPAEARQELRRAILAAGSDLKAASEALGRNHAYLQQFVESGKPKYLHERDRERLVVLYNIDPNPLKPPPIKLAQAGYEKRASRTSDPPRPGDPIKDAREALIVHTWRQVPEEDQDLVIAMLNGLLSARGLPPIAA